MHELRRLTPRGDVFERYVFDEEERPGSELARQALNGRLDLLDDVGVVVCSLQRRSKNPPARFSPWSRSSSGFTTYQLAPHVAKRLEIAIPCAGSHPLAPWTACHAEIAEVIDTDEQGCDRRAAGFAARHADLSNLDVA
jgi:hypothetical protein